MKLIKKWIIAILVVIALLNLGYIFILSDYITPAKETTNAPAETVLNVPTDPLTYNGTGELDLLEDVSAYDATGLNLLKQIKTSILPGESEEERVIRYEVTASDETVITKDRKLLLSNYKQPSIQPAKEISLVETQLTQLNSVLIRNRLIQIQDGFGNQVTEVTSENMKAEYKIDENGTYILTVSYTNFLQDTAVMETEIEVRTAENGPYIELTQTEAEVTLNSYFNPLSYVAVASDPNDGSLFRRIYVNGSVDTERPGDYILEYSARNYSGELSNTAVLTVTVVDPNAPVIESSEASEE